MKDLVSQCCQTKYRMQAAECGRVPACKQCGKVCNIAQPQAIVDATPPLDFSENEEQEPE